MSEYQLTASILAYSVAEDWESAKLEWELERISLSEESETCLCGHFPIKELCHLKNVRNKRAVIVGNCCVKKFMGIPSDKLFRSIRAVKQDGTRSLSEEIMSDAYRRGWIDSWEDCFYRNVRGKTHLSAKQLDVKYRINRKLLARFCSSKK